MITRDTKIKNNKGRVFKIESLNTHNGPGLRTVIYLKGCPLNCLWCHNPEGISLQKEIWVHHKKCIRCLKCISECPNSAIYLDDDAIEIDRNKCVGCYACVEVCPSDAIEKIGEDRLVSEVFNEIIKDKPFFDSSGGGITVTGGEPGLYPGFVRSLFKTCRENDIHTAFDTSGYISQKDLQMIIPYTDLVFYDLKIFDNKKSEAFIGKENLRIFNNLKWIKKYVLSNKKPELQFRTPIIPGATNDIKNLEALAGYIEKNFVNIHSGWELNLFNDICQDKYQKLNRKWNFVNSVFDSDEYNNIEKFQSRNSHLKISISGFIHKST